MGKSTTLRILEGTVLPQKVLDELNKLFDGYEIEYYKEKPDYRSHIERRINSLYEAFLFMLDAYPLSPDFTPLTAQTLKAYALECKEACDLKKKDLPQLDSELEKYTEKLIDVISIAWKWSGDNPLPEAIDSLNEAELYSLMGKGRTDLATVTPLQVHEEMEYVVQWDKSLPPYYDELIKEVQSIKDKGYPKTPAWYRKLPNYQQTYLSNLVLTEGTPTAVMQDFDGFLLSWHSIKSKSHNIGIELQLIQNNSPPLPAWFNELSPARQLMIRELAADPKSINIKLKKFKTTLLELSENIIYQKSIGTVVALPQWYWTLTKVQQYFFAHTVKNAKTIEDALYYVSSRHRTLPLPANLAAHSLLKINEQGAIKHFFGDRYRSSHIITRDGLEFPEAVLRRHSQSIYDKIMSYAELGQSRLLQTLISPIFALDYIPPFITEHLLPDLPPDLPLYKLLRETVANSKDPQSVFQHNHPMNVAKRLYYTKSNDADSVHLLKSMRLLVVNNSALEELLNEYEKVLNSPMGSATVWDYVGRELYLSSLEQLIILTAKGLSYGSCVSGKDRKAIELIHTDAMILYKELYGVWPNFSDAKDSLERTRFVNLFVELYVSRHQHIHAGQNAPGSEGIKTPHWYLPPDICEAINLRLNSKVTLKNDDLLASDNEVHSIVPKDKKIDSFSKSSLLCKLMAKQLGEEGCTALYDALNPLINEKRRFISKSSSWTPTYFSKSSSEGEEPTGIKLIREIMTSQESGSTNVLRLEKIFLEVLQRPESDETRNDETNAVYDNIRMLLRPLSSGTTLTSQREKVTDKWKDLFNASKAVNSSVLVQ